MQTYQKILVALDIYGDHLPVLDRALKVAESGRDLHLIYVTMPQLYFEPYGMALPEDFDSELKHQATAKLEEIAQQQGLQTDQVSVSIGTPADEIHQTAQDIDADLIVIGTHGRSGLSLLLGSTANAVLHGVKRDVLAVRL